jgi:nitrite reductase/ring-hydroxylating ferredoxin subunit
MVLRRRATLADCWLAPRVYFAQRFNALDRYLTPDGRLILCSWHGALYQVESGRCVGGPCAGQALRPWPVTAQDGQIVTLGPAPQARLEAEPRIGYGRPRQSQKCLGNGRGAWIGSGFP